MKRNEKEMRKKEKKRKEEKNKKEKKNGDKNVLVKAGTYFKDRTGAEYRLFDAATLASFLR